MRGCIEHTQRGNSGGYGTVKRDGRTEYAHRAAYADSNGVPISSLKGSVVMHSCDNPRCINPEHLVLGTHSKNMRDMVSKGRNNPPKGEQHPQSRLTTTQINSVRERYVPRCSTNGARALGRELGVSNSTIRDALKHRTWKES